ncbi:MAG: OFA family MFS transporter [Piscinibacter sp.]|uniref:L-lactate MFS transporter n=1 Tax=Piscinibacter sp. TaxID=1903157 RepID=UPI002583D9DD|nr:OFA family MFS transporter [Piscinibacter sp.]MCW5662874.1 OFA family MFS transporter [Piscinibacter sp.]
MIRNNDKEPHQRGATETMSKIEKSTAVLVAGTCINLTIGVLYAWSVVKKALVSDWGWTHTDASMPYNVAIVVWAVALLAAGAMQDRIGPRKIITSGVVLVGVGMILSGLVPSSNVLALTLAFGGIVGTGIGFAYACVTPAAMKWFHPGKKGLVSGITVGGFGLAAVYLAPLCTKLIAMFGISHTFLILGSAVLLIGLPLTRLISNPPEGFVPIGPAMQNGQANASVSAREYPWRQMLKTRQFYFLWVMFLFSSSAGVMIIGNLASIATVQAGIANPALLVSLLAICNATGRVGGGVLSDKIGRTNTMLLAFALQAANMLLFASYRDEMTLIGGIVTAGIAYGALMSVFPSTTADFYGLKNYGANYGVLYTAWGVSGFVGPLLAGWAVDSTGSFRMAYNASAGLLVVAILLGLLTRPPSLIRARGHGPHGRAHA